MTIQELFAEMMDTTEYRKMGEHKFSSYTDNLVDNTVFSKEPVYKLGQASEVKAEGFSLAKVMDKMGVKEVAWGVGEYANEEGIAAAKFGRISGVSSLSTKTFTINPDTNLWLSTIFHELGHLFLKHKYTEYEQLLDKLSNSYIEERQEMEAIVFGMCVRLRLGMIDSINHTKEAEKYQLVTLLIDGGGKRLSPEHISELDKKAEEFIQLGK
jgi:hypothetical protein